MTNNTENKIKAQRSRKSPGFTLEKTLELARQIKDSLGSHPSSADMLANSLGHNNRNNGAAARKIGSLVHYNLVTRENNGQYSLSELSTKILMPTSDEEKHEAICEAAKKPALYSELLAKYTNSALPSMLSNILTREYGIISKKSNEVAETFKQTMEFAGLLRNGILYDEPQDMHPSATSQNQTEEQMASSDTSSENQLPIFTKQQSGETNTTQQLSPTNNNDNIQQPLPQEKTLPIILSDFSQVNISFPKGINVESINEVIHGLNFLIKQAGGTTEKNNEQ